MYLLCKCISHKKISRVLQTDFAFSYGENAKKRLTLNILKLILDR